MAKKKTTKKAPAAKKSGRTTLEVDFSDTQSRKGEKRTSGKHFKPGDYLVRVKGVPGTGKSPEKKTPYVEFVYEFVGGKYKGNTISDRCYLSPGALWRLRNALEAMGVKVPSKRTKLDLKKCKGKELGITIDDDERDDDKVYSEVVDTFKKELVEESDDEDEDEDEDDLDDDDEDEDEDDEDEDEDEDEEDDEDDEDEDEDDDDEEEEDDDLEELELDDL